MIKLGDKVKDTITDYEGTVIAKIIYLNGCVRYEVKAKGLKDGKPIDSEWIDEEQLVCKKEAEGQGEKEVTGGPGSVPSGFSKPSIKKFHKKYLSESH